MLLCVIAEKNKQKPKRTRSKKYNILEPAVKKTKVQATDNEEKKGTSEVINKISKTNSNDVQENNASKRPNQTIFSSSLYTQELSNRETENSKDKHYTDTKTLKFDSNSEESLKESAKQAEAASSRTKSVNLFLSKCKQPSTSTSNEGKKATDEVQMLSDDESETHFSVASKKGEDIMNFSQDLFLSQNVTTEQNTLQKKNADTNNGTTTVIGSTQLVLQHDTNNQSTTNSAPIGSHLNCSDSVLLVPNIQFNTVHTETNRLDHQNGDAVVPQLSSEDYESVGFEPEE